MTKEEFEELLTPVGHISEPIVNRLKAEGAKEEREKIAAFCEARGAHWHTGPQMDQDTFRVAPAIRKGLHE